MAASDIDPGLRSLAGDHNRHRRERLIRGVFLSAAVFSILISVAIVLSLIGNAIGFLGAIDLSNLWTGGWFPRRGMFDIKTPIVASLIVSLLAMVVAVPLGLGAAIYLSEYASSRVRRWLKPIIEILAGVPSVVLGYFALTWLSPNIVQTLFPQAPLQSLLAASLGVGVLITPLMASISEDALRSVPQELREASYGLGARKRTTVLRVVVPGAVSGIVASMIITVSRAIGETMVMTIAAGAASGSSFTVNPLESAITLTSAIANLATGTDAVKGQTGTFESLYFAGIVLFLVTFSLNVVGDRVVRRYRKAL